MGTHYEHGRKGGGKLTCNGQYGNAAWTPVVIRRTPPKPAQSGCWMANNLQSTTATAYRGDITPLVQSRGLDRHTHQDSSQPRACLVSARDGIPSFDALAIWMSKELTCHGGDDRPYMSGRLQFNLYHGRHLPIVWHNERKWAP
ncbi:uncharacterized protein BO96DRAFT_393825 [Aspergillus niger CBS 101883]|uniref:Uncharacterized protein n=2 Tax=Aspergillus niger TaxID=5061 RepID=A2QPX5_ASPNC|nr:uncharacterized protein BO96DRAFT_393825 [Aspergillus niger CBS 101883]XP_059603873.1 hypothetical protein An08g00530 [Aspergillus niger]PYH56369.1 hypothetical protein BO96DRAFT_393825 [Aspergillus niger CBS 101883]CAK45205.1 hypothetical protein An08g00530 [Aspergillus niger]